MALLGQPIDERTAALALPLPHIGNYQEDDVPRLRAALELIDTALQLMGLDMDSRDDALAAAKSMPQMKVYFILADGADAYEEYVSPAMEAVIMQ